MQDIVKSQPALSRRRFLLATSALALSPFNSMPAAAANLASLDERFDFLSKHGNSTCSAKFTESIASGNAAAGTG